MNNLEEFVGLLAGKFDNSEQMKTVEAEGIKGFPFSEHVNTICNGKIDGLPQGFAGVFLVEESYYTVEDKTRAVAHLFLFTQEGEDVLLTSYDLPEGCGGARFTYENMPQTPYGTLKPSSTFTPARYSRKGDAWEGGSVSMFSPALKFTLWERFSPEVLEVSETMEVNRKKTMGYDRPILYKRK